jgi:hypothetical protein
MKKPELRTREFYDYLEIRDYIQEKYNIDERDYKRKFIAEEERIKRWKEYLILEFGKTYEELLKELGHINDLWATTYNCKEPEINIPYCDYWHFLLSKIFYDDIENGCYRIINWSEVLEVCKEDWQREITNLYIKEFGKEDMEIYIWW